MNMFKKRFAIQEITREVLEIETNDNLNKEEKIQKERALVDYYTGHSSYIIFLREGLYNLLLMIKNNSKGILPGKAISSLKGLRLNALIYPVSETYSVETPYGIIEKTYLAYALTELGVNMLKSCEKRGTQLAKEQSERLKLLGF